MTINHTPKEMPTGECNPTAGDTINDTNFPTAGSEGKALATPIARLAVAGNAIHKGQSDDFIVCKYGLSRRCKVNAELKAFSLKLGVTP